MDLELHAGSYHMALYDAGISDFNIMTYSSVLPADAKLVTMDEVDLPPFGSEMKTIMAVLSHGTQDEFVSAGVVITLGCMPTRTLRKGGRTCVRVSGRYRIEELESRLFRVITALHEQTCSHFYLGEPTYITEGITISGNGTALLLQGLCFMDFAQPQSSVNRVKAYAPHE